MAAGLHLVDDWCSTRHPEEVAAELGRSLDHFGVPAREKDESWRRRGAQGSNRGIDGRDLIRAHQPIERARAPVGYADRDDAGREGTAVDIRLNAPTTRQHHRTAKGS